MPTLRGWICAALGAISVGLGFAFGPVELYIVGAALLALAIIAVVVAVMRPLRLGVGRSVNPPRLHVGATSRVEVAIRNGSSRGPVMRMTDRVAGTAGAQLLIAPLGPEEVVRAAYRLPTERRGIVEIGPVDFDATDPFGLARRQFTAPSVGSLIVYPEIIALPAAPPSPATDRRSNTDMPEFLGGRSEEFHALRSYVPGDDIRRINWAASARHDELIVREDETPTQNHLTVLLDNAAIPDGLAMDRAATVAGSLIASMRNRADPFRLVTVDGKDTGYVLGSGGIDTALAILAVIDHQTDRRLLSSPVAPQGAVVVVTTGSPSIDRAELDRFGRVMWLQISPSAWDEGTARSASSVEVVNGEIRLELATVADLPGLWTRAITTLLSSASRR